MTDDELRRRSLRTLAWIGDAEFEREVRLRVARRGDYPTHRLDRVRAAIVRAEAQAAMLERIEPQLSVDEQDVVRRARNLRAQGRTRRDVGSYRAATALEALVAHWCLAGEPGHTRFHAVLGDLLEAAIDTAIAKVPPRRG